MPKSRLRERLGAGAIVAATALLCGSGPAEEVHSSACGWCIDSAYDGAPAHYFHPEGTHWSAGAHSYVAYSTCGQHPPCAFRLSDKQLKDVSKSLPALRGDQLRTLARSHPGQLRYDPERRVVEVIGAESHVLGRYPVRPDQEQALLAE